MDFKTNIIDGILFQRGKETAVGEPLPMGKEYEERTPLAVNQVLKINKGRKKE